MKGVVKLGLCAVSLCLGLAATSSPAWALNDQQKKDLKASEDAWNAIPSHTFAPQVTQALSVESALPAYSGPDEVVFEMPENAPAYITIDGSGALFYWTERVKITPGQLNTVRIDGVQCFRDYRQTRDPGTQSALDSITAAIASTRDPKQVFERNKFEVGNYGGCENVVNITDRSGLIDIERSYGDNPFPQIENRGTDRDNFYLEKITSLSIMDTSPINENRFQIPFSSFSITYVGHGDSFLSNIVLQCTLGVGNENSIAKGQCSTTGLIGLDGLENFYTVNSKHTISIPWNDILGMYLPDEGDLCLSGACGLHATAHNIIDYRKGSQWHSQVVSAGLSPADKQKANNLFSTGFDSYKSGDFTSASALMKRGLEIDPASYLAWFTLAEIARSKHLQDANDIWAVHIALYDYQRTLDLSPPDTPEAIKSQAHLTAHGVD